jgi:hypothetical protein
MAYIIKYALEVLWVPDGAGPLSVPSAQKLKLGTLEYSGLTVVNPQNLTAGQPTGFIQVPGGNAASQANFRTALQGSSGAPTAGGMTADLDAAIATNLARIQGFATGGG